MPRKYNAPNSPWYRIPIRNDITGQREEVIGTVDTPHLREIGRPRRQKYTPYKKPVFHYDPEYMAQCVADAEEDLTRLRRLHELVMEERRQERLADRISDIKLDDKPLIERVTPAYVPDIKPLPNINFKKIKIQKRQQELDNVIKAAGYRIHIFRMKKELRDVRSDLKEEVEKFLQRFDEFATTFPQRVQKYTNKDWRCIKRDLKAVKGIPLYNLGRRWEDVCSEFAALGRQERFVYSIRA